MQLVCLIFIADIAYIKSHPGCQFLYSSSAGFTILTLIVWNLIQTVSCVQLFCLISFYCWHCLYLILSSEWVVCSLSAWFLFLTLPAWNFIQLVSSVQILCLISISDISYMESHTVSQLWTAPLLNFHCWHCLHEILFRKWFIYSLSVWFTLLT